MRRQVCLELVELAAKDEAGEPVWIQIATAGQFKGHSAGPFELSASVFSEIVRNFGATQNKRVAIDFEHASEMSAADGSIPTLGAPAVGWVTALDNRGDSLWALVEWLEPAKSYIKEGKYRYISPAIRFGARDRVTGQRIGAVLSSVALTNHPFLDGMMPVAAKDLDGDEPSETEKNMDLEVALAKLADSQLALSDAQNKVGASQAEIATLKLDLKEKTVEAENATEELTALRAWRAEREEKDLSERVDEAFATHKDAKRLADEDKSSMLIELKANPAQFEKRYPKIAREQQYLGRNLSDKRDAAQSVSLTEGEQPTSFLALTKQIMKEKHLGYEAAQNLAARLTKRTG